ncbi:DUF1697 domain-containing protein [Rhizobium sp. KVB221]|uniref:DUF1697 domain-containing protein n=1 Tax=Rhizobium setariae TaxID=2801340 RepID=A0A936YIX8_9HYPH|nr:DUF1697 domain-containing protein [Rhizobium setariae]MBL0370458.1 DUF1697 domain-containing protein [Rhizobium setariae]
MADQTYIALLRGINVGGKVLKMADLRQAVSMLDLADIQTYLQSGNMVFRAQETEAGTLAPAISQAIADKCAMDVHVLVRTANDWSHIVAANPFLQAAEHPRTLHAFILDRQPESANVEELMSRDFGADEWKIVGVVLYLHAPDGFGKSKLAGLVERVLKVPMTARNWNTMLALDELARSV